MMRYVLSEKKDFELDEGILFFLREHRPEVLFLCNPNNPTGRLTDPILLKKSCRKAQIGECGFLLTSAFWIFGWRHQHEAFSHRAAEAVSAEGFYQKLWDGRDPAGLLSVCRCRAAAGDV